MFPPLLSSFPISRRSTEREGKGREGKGNCRRAAIFQARSNEPASNRRGNDRDNKWNPLIGRRFIIPLAPREPSARGRERASYPSRRPNWPFNERTNEQTNKQRLSSLVLSPPPSFSDPSLLYLSNPLLARA